MYVPGQGRIISELVSLRSRTFERLRGSLTCCRELQLAVALPTPQSCETPFFEPLYKHTETGAIPQQDLRSQPVSTDKEVKGSARRIKSHFLPHARATTIFPEIGYLHLIVRNVRI